MFSNGNPWIEASISGELGGELTVEELSASSKVDGREDAVIDENGGGCRMSDRSSLFCAFSSRLFILLVVIIVSGFSKDLWTLVGRGVGVASGSTSGMMNF